MYGVIAKLLLYIGSFPQKVQKDTQTLNRELLILAQRKLHNIPRIHCSLSVILLQFGRSLIQQCPI